MSLKCLTRTSTTEIVLVHIIDIVLKILLFLAFNLTIRSEENNYNIYVNDDTTGHLMMFAGQQTKPCKNCENPLHFFCTSCNYGLCEDCAVIHLLSTSDSVHNIVHYRDRYSGKTATGLCEKHDNNDHEFACTYCRDTLCPDCVQRHNMIACNVIKIKDFVCDKVKYLNEQNDFLSNVIKPKLESMITEIRSNLQKFDFCIFENEIDSYEKKWYDEIKKIIQELTRYGRHLYKQSLKKYVQNLLRLEDLHLQTNIILQENREKLRDPEYILSSSHPCTDKIGINEMELSAEKEMSDFKKKILNIDKHIDNAAGELKEKTFTDQTSIKKPFTHKILRHTFAQTPSITPVAISCRIPDVILISLPNTSSDSKLLKFDHTGKLFATVSTEFKVEKMAFMRNGDFLSLHQGMIFQVTSDSTSVWKKLDNRYTTTDITISANEEVYACQKQIHSGVRVVKWDINGSKLQTIEDIAWSVIGRRDPSHIHINGNTNICITVDGRTSALVVTNKKGGFRFVYRAKVKIDGLATNSYCHIFVNERKQITELDKNGYLLRHIKEGSVILFFDFDSDDNMWIIHSRRAVQQVERIEKITFRA